MTRALNLFCGLYKTFFTFKVTYDYMMKDIKALKLYYVLHNLITPLLYVGEVNKISTQLSP